MPSRSPLYYKTWMFLLKLNNHTKLHLEVESCVRYLISDVSQEDFCILKILKRMIELRMALILISICRFLMIGTGCTCTCNPRDVLIGF